MGKFEDFLDNVDLNNGIPDGFLTGLRAAHDDDLSIPLAKVTALETEKTELNGQLTKTAQELTAAKAKNFDLLMQIPKQDDNDNQPVVTDNIDDIDDLFE